MNYKKLHALGITKIQLNDIKCSCGSSNVEIGYFFKSDEYQATCNACQKDGCGVSWQNAVDHLSPLNSLRDIDNQPSIIDSL